jgi:putative transposase
MPAGLVRYQQSKQFHFVTFSCYQRKPLLQGDWAKEVVERVLETTRRERCLCVAAYVLMPEHVHLLANEPGEGTLASFIQVLKQRTARELKRNDEPQFWQRRYYDFNVSSHEKYIQKIRYIHRNPVERGLFSRPEDYRWSSFRHYATGHTGAVEIESEWTARRRERGATDGLLPTLRCAKDGAAPEQ